MNAPRRSIAAAMSEGLGGVGHPRISIDNNEFTLLDAGNNAYVWPHKEMQIIILDANQNVSKRLFDPAVPYDPRNPNPAPPLCWSDNGIAPSKRARAKQAASCAQCEFNEWGSDVSKATGKDIKACRDFKKIACYVVDQNTGQVSDMMYEFDIPPNSLKTLKIYGGRIASFQKADGNPADVSDVITWVWFVSQGTLGFAEAAWVNPDQEQKVLEAWQKGLLLDQLVGRNDVPADPSDFQLTYQGAPATPLGPAPAPAPQVSYQSPAQPQPQFQPPGPTPIPPQPQAPQAPQTRGQRGGARPGSGRRPGRPPNAAPAPAPGFSPPQNQMQLEPPPPRQEIIPPNQPGGLAPFGAHPASNSSPSGNPPQPGFGGAGFAASPSPAPNDPGELPGFLRRGEPGGMPPGFGGQPPQPGPNGTRGGFQQPQPTNMDVNDALATAFNQGAPRS